MMALAPKSSAILDDIKHHAGRVACQTPFYHWLLSSGDMPSQLSVRLSDPWSGDGDVGRLLGRGVLRANGVSLPLDGRFWDMAAANPFWLQTVHSFAWMRDLRAAGGDQSRRIARKLADCWMDLYDRWHADIWRGDIMGDRIAIWLSFYDFFCGSADEDFQRRYFASLNRQARHLSRQFPSGLSGVALLKAARGLIYAGLSLPGRDDWILQGFECILKEIPKQITKDGLHVSQSPQQLLECTRIFLDLRYALNRASLPVPKALQNVIEQVGPALRFFSYPDRKFAVLHGGQECDAAEIESVLSQMRAAKRAAKLTNLGGFERVMVGRSLLMMDGSVAPDAPHDTQWHSAPLSFEFLYGRERIFTHCGGHPSHPEWQQILRHTAAHNTLVVDGRPAHELRADLSVGRSAAFSGIERSESRDACLISGVQKAYMASLGLVHSRRLFLTDQGHDLRGEDTVTFETAPDSPRDLVFRFHLHPKVQVSQVSPDQDVVLSLPVGGRWRFYGVGAHLDVEPSIYLGQGIKPVPTQQLVLKTSCSGGTTQIKWALQRE